MKVGWFLSVTCHKEGRRLLVEAVLPRWLYPIYFCMKNGAPAASRTNSVGTLLREPDIDRVDRVAPNFRSRSLFANFRAPQNVCCMFLEINSVARGQSLLRQLPSFTQARVSLVSLRLIIDGCLRVERNCAERRPPMVDGLCNQGTVVLFFRTTRLAELEKVPRRSSPCGCVA